MNESLAWAPALLAGLLLGALFFGGLWWTIQRGLDAKNPALWFLASLLLRSGGAVLGFYFVADGDWRRLLACLAGFLMARAMLTRLARPPAV